MTPPARSDTPPMGWKCECGDPSRPHVFHFGADFETGKFTTKCAPFRYSAVPPAVVSSEPKKSKLRESLEAARRARKEFHPDWCGALRRAFDCTCGLEQREEEERLRGR